MDYEKKYKEVLENAKHYHREMGDDVCCVLEEIFPELKESGDKKIRKAISDILLIDSDEIREILDANNILMQDIDAWLEKQGESYTKRDINDAYLKGVTDTKNEIEKQYEATYQIRKDIATFIFNYRGDIKDRAKWMDYLSIKVSFIEKQSEQPRYSIGDVLCDKSCTTLNKETQPNFEIIDIRNGMYIGDKCSFPISQQDEYELVAKKIESKFKVNDWVVVSTTEGDRVVQIASVEYSKDGYPSYITTEGRWFGNGTKARLLTDKDVETITLPESKIIISHKSAEWSEEDERIYRGLHNLIYATPYCDSRKELSDWLKSLKDRYTWKPSEEQMESLANALSLAKNCGEESAFDLRTLYEQLKQL